MHGFCETPALSEHPGLGAGVDKVSQLKSSDAPSAQDFSEVLEKLRAEPVKFLRTHGGLPGPGLGIQHDRWSCARQVVSSPASRSLRFQFAGWRIELSKQVHMAARSKGQGNNRSRLPLFSLCHLTGDGKQQGSVLWSHLREFWRWATSPSRRSALGK